MTLSQSCLPLVCLWDCKLVSVPKFMYWYFRTCSCDVFSCSRSLSDAAKFASDLFLECDYSIPRSLSDNNHVWIWCSLSILLPAALKNVANSLSMFYRCLRFRLLIGIRYFFGRLKLAELTSVHGGSKIFPHIQKCSSLNNEI